MENDRFVFIRTQKHVHFSQLPATRSTDSLLFDRNESIRFIYYDSLNETCRSISRVSPRFDGTEGSQCSTST